MKIIAVAVMTLVLCGCIPGNQTPPPPRREELPKAAMAPCPPPPAKRSILVVDAVKPDLERYEASYKECAARQAILATYIRRHF